MGSVMIFSIVIGSKSKGKALSHNRSLIRLPYINKVRAIYYSLRHCREDPTLADDEILPVQASAIPEKKPYLQHSLHLKTMVHGHQHYHYSRQSGLFSEQHYQLTQTMLKQQQTITQSTIKWFEQAYKYISRFYIETFARKIMK